MVVVWQSLVLKISIIRVCKWKSIKSNIKSISNQYQVKYLTGATKDADVVANDDAKD